MVGKPSAEAAAGVSAALQPLIGALEADPERVHLLDDQALLEACKGVPRTALVELLSTSLQAHRASSGGVRGDVGQSVVAISTTRPAFSRWPRLARVHTIGSYGVCFATVAQF